MKKTDTKHLAVVNLDALLKLVEENDKENEEEFNKLQDELKKTVTQYNLVVEQNKGLQGERNVYRKTLEEIQAIAGKSKSYSSTATKIYDKCAEVL